VAFAFGFTVLTMAYAVGHISGGHFNPAVTVAMVLDRRTTANDAVGYIVGQVIGAIAAAAVVLIVAGQGAVAAGVTKPGSGISDIGALILEVVMTAGFVTVILTATKRSPGLAPLVIPLTLIAIHFGSATVSGASVNPARSIGSALVGGNLGALWIYLVAPILGAIVGWAVFMALDEDEPAPVS
jgi:aquaporin Z